MFVFKQLFMFFKVCCSIGLVNFSLLACGLTLSAEKHSLK